MSARRIAVSARLSAEDAAFLRSLGAASDADAVRLLIAEARAGASIERSVAAALTPVLDRLDTIEARQIEQVEAATRRALDAVIETLAGG